MDSWWPLLFLGLALFCLFGMRRCVGAGGCYRPERLDRGEVRAAQLPHD